MASPRGSSVELCWLWTAVLLSLATLVSSTTMGSTDRPGSPYTMGSGSLDSHSGDVGSMSGDVDAMVTREATLASTGSGFDQDAPSSGRSELTSDPEFKVIAPDTAGSGDTSDVSGQETTSPATSPSASDSPEAVQPTTQAPTAASTTRTMMTMPTMPECQQDSECSGTTGAVCLEGRCQCGDSHVEKDGKCQQQARDVGQRCNVSEDCRQPLLCGNKDKDKKHLCACPEEKFWSESNKTCLNDSLIQADIALTRQAVGALNVSWSVNFPQDVASYRLIWWLVLEGLDNERGSRIPSATSPYSVRDLVPGHMYKIRVVSLTKHKFEDVRNEVYYVEDPSPVRSLSVENTTTDCVSLRWEAGEGVRDSFSVEVRALEGEGPPLTPLGVNLTEGTVCQLTPGSRYHVSLVSQSRGKNSTPVYVEAMTVPEPPSQVEVSRNSSCLHLNWTRPQGRYDVIRVQLAPGVSKRNSQAITVTENATASETALCGLEPGKVYDVSVTSERGNLTSRADRITEGTCAAPVTNVNWTEEESGHVLVTWLPQGVVTSYVTQLQGGDVTLRSDLKIAEWRINGTLRPGVLYKGSILARANNCSDGETFFSIELPTSVPDAVRTNVSWSGEEGLRVEWLPPDPRSADGSLHFRINVTQGGQLFRNLTVPGNQTSWNSSVPRGECYTVSVSAVNSQGRSEPSPASLQVPDDAPGPVANLSATPTSVGVVTVHWATPTQPNGVITGYVLNVTDVDSGADKVYYFNCTDNCSSSCSDAPQSYSGLDTGETTLALEAPFAFNVSEFCPPATLAISLQAFTSFGPGDVTDTSLTLEGEKPGPARNFTATPLNASAVRLQWEKPLPRDFCDVNVTSYRLTYYKSIPSPATSARTLDPRVSHAPSQVGGQQVTGTPRQWNVWQPTRRTSPPPSGTVLPVASSTNPPFATSPPKTPSSTPLHRATDVTSPPIGQSRVTETISGSNRDFLLVGLEYWTTYVFSLVPVGDAGEGPATSTFTSTAEHVPTSPVRDLRVKDKSNTSLTVTWQPPLKANGVIRHYQVEARTAERACRSLGGLSGASSLQELTNTSEASITLEGLAPFWEYNVSVVPCTAAGCGKVKSLVQDRTAPDVPSAMLNTTWNEESVEGTRVELSWNPVCFVNDLPSTLQYTVEYGAAALSQDTTTLPTNDTTVVLKELRPLTRYNIRVSASNSRGRGQASDWFVFNTSNKAPTNVTTSTVVALNSTCIRVTWSGGEVPRGSEVNRSLEVKDEDSGDLKVVDCPQNRECQVCGLTPHWSYSLQVVVANSLGEARSPSPLPVTTEGAAPGQVQNVSVSVTRENDVTAPRYVNVTWSPPLRRERNGVITDYVISISSRSSATMRYKVQEDSTYPSTYTQSIPVMAEAEYRVEVWAESRYGAGDPRRFQTPLVPSGAPPRPLESEGGVALVTRNPTTDLLDSSRQLSLSLHPSFLCNSSFGRPRLWGVLVQAGSPTQLAAAAAAAVGFRGSRDEYLKQQRVWFQQHQHSHFAVHLREFHCPTPDRFTVVMGRDGECEGLQPRQCNGWLLPSTHYRFRAFMCTTKGCTETPFSHIMKTDDPEGLRPAVIAVIVFFPVFFIVLVAVVFLVRRRRRKSASRFPTEKIGMRMMDNARGQRVTTSSTGSEFIRSRPIKLVNFAQHVEQMHQQSNLGFSDEFKKLKAMSPAHSTKTAELLACKLKNRYQNILPFDRTRVKLLPNDDEEGSDYINANFLMGYSHKREYIAAQGPLPGTIDDFWRMVWEQKVKVIVMLTQCVERGKVKCEEYWPECGEPVYHGDLLVQVRSQSVLPSYVIRIIDLVLGDTKRTIKHFHFLKWPDFGCPEKTWLLLNFVSAVRSHIPHDSGPIVIHCSAGVGRTGTFIAVDYALQHIKEHDDLDILGLVLQMRDSRTQMVQNESQYVYIHDCIRDALEEETDDEEEEEEETMDEPDEHIYMNSSECQEK